MGGSFSNAPIKIFRPSRESQRVPWRGGAEARRRGWADLSSSAHFPYPPAGGLFGARAGSTPGLRPRPRRAASRPRAEVTQSRARHKAVVAAARGLEAARPRSPDPNRHPGHRLGRPPAGPRWRRRQRQDVAVVLERKRRRATAVRSEPQTRRGLRRDHGSRGSTCPAGGPRDAASIALLDRLFAAPASPSPTLLPPLCPRPDPRRMRWYRPLRDSCRRPAAILSVADRPSSDPVVLAPSFLPSSPSCCSRRVQAAEAA